MWIGDGFFGGGGAVVVVGVIGVVDVVVVGGWGEVGEWRRVRGGGRWTKGKGCSKERLPESARWLAWLLRTSQRGEMSRVGGGRQAGMIGSGRRCDGAGGELRGDWL